MQVKLLPDIFPEAHRLGEGALLRVWYLARTVSTEHGYRIQRAVLIKDIVQYLNVKERYANQLLENGDNLWWRLDSKNDLVYMLGAKALSARLNCAASNAPAVRMSIEHLAHLKDFYATCYAAYMQRYVHGKQSEPVSRAKLMVIFGVTRNTLRRWEKEAGVIVIENFAFALPNIFRNMPDRHVEYHCKCGKAFNTFDKFTAHRAECQEKEYVLVWDRPNSYAPPTMPTAGTASPICISRMTQYQRRQDRKPSATRCEIQTGSPDQPKTHSNDLQKSETRPTASYRYRALSKSDPVPMTLLTRCEQRGLRLPLKRLMRAVSVVQN